MLAAFLSLIYFAPPSRVSEEECDDSRFTYIIKLMTYERLCFGTTKNRETGFIGKGLSPQQKRLMPENNPRTGPGCYNTEKIGSAFHKVLSKKRSIKGSSGLASQEKRIMTTKSQQTPSPMAYQPVSRRFVVKKSAKPFGTGAKIREIKLPNIPGPADYNLQNISLCHRSNFQSNFGSPTRSACVKTICVVEPTDTCHLCNKICGGEYWHQNYTKFLCQSCFMIELATNEFYSLDELKQLTKIRNCSFMHQHEKTTAALTLLPRNKLKKKLDIENYLESYIKCF
ncbi:uncharacterized protein LOC126884663 [Diabrotica virgifera virgifera]|uniref:Uncharacterized protein n=1 Tax=Diabrotica virgifera virgifera TaxID=50390 RepID=A0ABM5K923_DIAVI|nr:uncharacterized protein LOC126884663 [Diabrotica virgifera virgifera]